MNPGILLEMAGLKRQLGWHRIETMHHNTVTALCGKFFFSSTWIKKSSAFNGKAVRRENITTDRKSVV